MEMKGRKASHTLSQSGVLLLVIIASLISNSECRKYCTSTSDCKQLGDLKCLKSQCNWGLCGCDRGYSAKYLGSEKLFKCVKLKKIDEDCSTKDDTGICGAKNSECVQGKCSCESGYQPAWGGEICLHKNQTFPSENLLSKHGQCVRSGMSSHDQYFIFYGLPATCACSKGTYTYLSNDMVLTADYFLGKKFPICAPVRLGDVCITRMDCPSTMKCSTENRCVCSEEYDTYTYDETTCIRSNETVGLGMECESPRNCDGKKGLNCGDICQADMFVPPTCACGASHETRGKQCIPRTLGSFCYGDGNCKNLGYNGICVDSKCQNGAGSTRGGLLSSVMLIILAICRLN